MILSHPFRITAAGTAATLDADGPAACAQTAGHVLACQHGERPLAPMFGLPDPTGAAQVSPDLVRAALGVCAPELRTDTVNIHTDPGGTVTITVGVDWADEEAA